VFSFSDFSYDEINKSSASELHEVIRKEKAIPAIKNIFFIMY